MSITLFQHQRQAVKIANNRQRFMFAWDCGTGKTMAILAIVARQGGKTLVVCPKSIMRAAWKNDAANFPHLRVVIAWSDNKAKRTQLIKSDADVIITNYATFRSHANDFLEADFHRIVIDESSCLKNHKAQITKLAVGFAEFVPSVYLLSGTPAPNHPKEYWAQARCIDSAIFDSSYYRFCAKWFAEDVEKYGTTIVKKVGKFHSEGHEERFYALLRSVSWSMQKHEAMDLPKQMNQVREVVLSPQEKKAYNDMVDLLCVECKDGVVSASASAQMMKLRQITGGTIYHADQTLEIGKSKLMELVQVLDELAGKQVVIWAEFRSDLDRICGRLPVGTWGRLSGGTKNTGEIVEKFQRGELQYLVCQPQSAGHGLTLTSAYYAVYYSWSFSFEFHKQSRDRIHRAGQTNPCTYIYLMAKDTVDEQLFGVLRQKANNHSILMDILSSANNGGHSKLGVPG